MAKKRKDKPFSSSTGSPTSFYLSYDVLDCIDKMGKMWGMGRSDVVDFLLSPFAYQVRAEFRKFKATESMRKGRFKLKLNFSHIYSTEKRDKLEREVRDADFVNRSIERDD